MAATADYEAYAAQQATANGVDPDVLARQIDQESGWNPDAESPAGAEGIAQMMPATAAGLGVDPWDPYQAIAGMASLMGSYLSRYGGDYSKALAAYNAGPGAVDQYGGVPPYPETQAYVAEILGGPAPTGSSGEAAAGGTGISGGAVAVGLGVLAVIWLLGD